MDEFLIERNICQKFTKARTIHVLWWRGVVVIVLAYG
jgi:hypothetical protein